MKPVNFSFPTQIQFGPGVRARLGDVLKTRGKARPLVLTDQGVAGLPFFKSIVADLDKAGLATLVFSGVVGNPVKSQVTAGVAAFKTHNADSLVVIGGGAALDVGKAVALMAHHPGDLFDYEDDKPDGLPVDREIPFIVAMPTTSGTGSEVGRSAVISDDATHVKKIVFSPRLLAPVVLADPELTLGLPAGMTAATGMDALSHCVEAFLSKGFHPMCDGIALEGVRLVSQSLVACVKEPNDIEARTNMMMASMMGAVAFQKGLGVTHSLAHSLSAVCDLHHGLANAIMLPAAMRFNKSAVADRMARLAATVGAGTTADAFVDWLVALNAEIGTPKTLGAVGVQRGHLKALVDIAVEDVCHGCNEKPVTREDFESLFAEAL